ncbi:hypothetical protein JHK87_016979 [Glycine soja]|nr:hypothetical protein JHK87_016979 [Glycine soja]
MALRVIAISAVSTVLSFVGLQFCTDLSLDKLTSDGLIGWNLIHLDNASQDIELPLGLYTTIGLLVNCMINVFILLNLCLKAVFFTELYASETRKLVERFINYVIYKMFQALARDRLERLNASPSATPWTYLRAILVHGFQLLDIWLHHSACNSSDFRTPKLLDMLTAGSLDKNLFFKHLITDQYDWDIKNMYLSVTSFSPDPGCSFTLMALLSAIINRIKGFIRLRIALGTLHAALPDATTEELRAYDDECAICREPMAKAKRLNCNHLFHLACLRSWLDQGLAEMYTCPTCRKPLFAGVPGNETNSDAGTISSDEQLARQISAGLDRPNSARHTMPTGFYPNQTLNTPEGVPWRGAGLDSGWLHSWPNQGVDGAGPSTAIRTVGLGRVQMMMRHLASVGETYAQTTLEDTAWNLWPINPSQASASGSTIPPPGGRLPERTGSLHLRTASQSSNDNVANILAMAETVREVLPHIPDDMIFQEYEEGHRVTTTIVLGKA